MERKIPLTALVAIALAGSAAVIVATSTFGIGISAESETYILAASNFAEGRGLVVSTATGVAAPLTQHAPLYAAFLGLCGRAGIDVMSAARWSSAACLGLLALLTGAIVRGLSKRAWLPPIASSLVLSSVVMLNLHLTALSEPLFLIATLAALYFLVRYLQTPDRRWLLVSSLACAAATLTRYAGIALIATGILAILRYDRVPAHRTRAVIFAAIASAPATLWALFTTVVAGNPVHREFALHALSARDAAAALQTFSTWILPAVVAPGIRFAVLAGVVLWVGGLLWRVDCPTPCKVFLGFMGCYAVTIVLAKSFFDAAIPMDDRILSPLYLPALLAVLLIVENAGRVLGRRLMVVVPAVMALLVVAGFNIVREVPCLATVYRSGREYSGASWRKSKLENWLHSVNPETPLYSNLDSAVRFLHPGMIRGLPPKADIRSGRPNPRYGEDLRRLRDDLAAANGLVVYFTDARVPDAYLPTLPELIQQLRLTVVARGDTWIALRV